MDASACWIVVVRVAPPSRMALFQALAEGEEGLAVVRCRDPRRELQELWTVRGRRDELLAWLRGLPPELVRAEVVEERPWRGERG